MPLAPPPLSASAVPHTVLLPVSTRLWRVHRKSRATTAFKDDGSDANFGGGRFDSTTDNPFPYLYAATEPETAILETRLRGIPFDSRGIRTFRRKLVDDHRLSPMLVAREICLVSLVTTPDLAAVFQDEWLIHSDVIHYPQTRRWGHWLRTQAAHAHGFIWPSIRDLGRQSLVIFGDRCPRDALVAEDEGAIDLAGDDGAAWINDRLRPYRFRIKQPARLERTVADRPAWTTGGSTSLRPVAEPT